MNVFEFGLGDADMTLAARINRGAHAGQWITNQWDYFANLPTIYALVGEVYGAAGIIELPTSDRFPYGYSIDE